MLGLLPQEVPLLRCEINRIARWVNASVKVEEGKLPTVSTSSTTIDDDLVDAAAEMAAWLCGQWETGLLRVKAKYNLFNVLYDATWAFINDQTAKSLAEHGAKMVVLAAAFCQFLGITDSCKLLVAIPGLTPLPDSAILLHPGHGNVPALPPEKPFKRWGRAQIVGGAAMASLGLLAVGMSTYALNTSEN